MTNPLLPYRPMIELSTAHVHKQDMDKIDEFLMGDKWSSGFNGLVGVVLWTGHADDHECPPRLSQTLGLARDAHGIDYVLFDADGPECELFTSYKDSWS